MSERYTAYKARHALEDAKMAAIERAHADIDFWSSWSDKIKATGKFDEERVDAEMLRYKMHATVMDSRQDLFPAGNSDFKRQLVEHVFEPLTQPDTQPVSLHQDLIELSSSPPPEHLKPPVK